MSNIKIRPLKDRPVFNNLLLNKASAADTKVFSTSVNSATGNDSNTSGQNNNITINHVRYNFYTNPNVATVVGIDDSETTVNIPEIVPINSIDYTVTIIENRALAFCEKITKFTTNNPKFYTDERGVLFSGTLSGPATLIQYPIGNPETSYTIPSNVISIEQLAFALCISLVKITVTGNSNFYTDDRGVLFSGTLSGPSTLIQYPIGNQATTYTIPNNVVSIGYAAFARCTSLIQFTVNNNSTFYTDNRGALFSRTTLIQYPIGNATTSYTIPNNVTSTRLGAFTYCTSLASVTIPDSITSLGEGAFYNCTSLATYKFIGKPPALIGHDAFAKGPIPPAIVNYYTSYASDWNSKFEGLKTVGLSPTTPDSPTNVVAIPGLSQACAYILNKVLL